MLRLSQKNTEERLEIIAQIGTGSKQKEECKPTAEFEAMVQTLQPCGFSEPLLRPFIMAYPVEAPFQSTHLNILIYLVSGVYPNPRDSAPPLILEQRLSPEQALNEIKGLNKEQLWALKNLYTLGLRGDLLRNFEGPEGFTTAHLITLQYFMRDRNPTMSALKAMGRIQGLTIDKVMEAKSVDNAFKLHKERMEKFAVPLKETVISTIARNTVGNQHAIKS